MSRKSKKDLRELKISFYKGIKKESGKPIDPEVRKEGKHYERDRQSPDWRR